MNDGRNDSAITNALNHEQRNFKALYFESIACGTFMGSLSLSVSEVYHRITKLHIFRSPVSMCKEM